MKTLAAKLGVALCLIGGIYWFGLVGLIVSSSPSGAGQGPGAWDGYMPAIPGLGWFIHAGKATALMLGGYLILTWSEKNKGDQKKEP